MAEATHTQAARLAARMQREIKILHSDPPPRVYAWPTQDHILTHLQAQIQGPDGTPYADGIFKLEIQIPDRYPFEPPNVRFVTPVYHPNIDNGGRICLDILNLPPKGEWKPSLNIGAVLSSIRLLLSEPNPDDGLMADISAEYKHNRADFDRKARLSTQKYAIQSNDNPETLPIDVLYPKTPLMKKQKTNNNSDPVLPQLDSSAKDKVVSVSCKANMAQPVSKKLSLARGSDLQQEKSCKQVLKDSQNLAHSKNINLHSAQNIDMGIQQGAVDTLFLGKSSHSNNPIPNDTSKQSSCLENASLAMPIDKENLHPSRNFKRLANLSKSTISTGCQETVQNIQSGPTGTEADFRKPRSDSKMHISGIQRPTIPLKDSVQAPQESVTPTKTFTNVKANEELEPQTIVVSDSESDEEPRPTRSRLSLGQLGLSAKRKRVS